MTPSGEKSFDEKIRTGCGYRVGKKINKYLQGMIGYMMTCDAYRCLFHPSAGAYYVFCASFAVFGSSEPSFLPHTRC